MKHLKNFNESNEFEQREGESSDDYIKRLCSMGDKSVKSLEQTFHDMKKDNVIGFCKHCGCTKYADIEHHCEVEESFQRSSIGELGYDELVDLFIENGIDKQTSGRLAEAISDAGGVSTVLNILSNI